LTGADILSEGQYGSSCHISAEPIAARYVCSLG
jgi:hypothetical protein